MQLKQNEGVNTVNNRRYITSLLLVCMGASVSAADKETKKQAEKECVDEQEDALSTLLKSSCCTAKLPHDDGAVLAFGSSVYFKYRKEAFKCLGSLSLEGMDWACAVAVAADGETAAVTSKNGVTGLWNLRTGELVKRFSLKQYDAEGNEVYVTALSPSGTSLAVGYKNNRIAIFSLAASEVAASDVEKKKADAVKQESIVYEGSFLTRFRKINYIDYESSSKIVGQGTVITSGQATEGINVWDLPKKAVIRDAAVYRMVRCKSHEQHKNSAENSLGLQQWQAHKVEHATIVKQFLASPVEAQVLFKNIMDVMRHQHKPSES